MEDLRSVTWRCRRGALELDIVLSRFLESSYQQLQAEEKQTFSKLLDEQDPSLLQWLMGRSLPENEKLAAIVKKIRDQN